MYPESLYAFILTCLLIESTPGPNMFYLTMVSATEGRKNGYSTTAGIAVGLSLIGIAAAVGLATIITTSPFLYKGLRVVGIVYMLWLAWQAWRAADAISPGRTKSGESLSSFFQHGLIVNVLNPKAAVFYVSILPTFIEPNDQVLSQAIKLTFISISIATTMHILIVTLAGFLNPLLEDPKRNKIIRRTLALLLASVAIWFGWPGQV